MFILREKNVSNELSSIFLKEKGKKNWFREK